MQRRILALIVGLVALAANSGVVQPALAQEEGAPLQTRWTRHGFGEMRAVNAVDLDGDGSDEVVAAGTGVVAIDATTLRDRRPRWEMKWNSVEGDVLSGGERPRSTGAELIDLPGLDAPQLLVTAENASAYLIDAATGEQRWYTASTGAHNSRGFALVDADADDVVDFLPTGSRTVHSGRTGEPLWTARDLPGNARLVASGEFDGEPGRDVAVAIRPPGAGTDPTTIPGAVTSPTLYVYGGDGELLYNVVAVAAIESLTAVDVDADGVDEVAYGTYSGTVNVVGSGGTLHWATSLGGGPITALIAGDLDGDGRTNLVAGSESSPEPSTATTRVVALDAAGATLWTHPVDHRVSLLRSVPAGDDRVLLVGAGEGTDADGGVVLALETGLVEADRQRWAVPTDRVVLSAARAVQNGREVALLGAADTALRAVDLSTGDVVWTFVGGGFVESVAAGDVDGDGLDEIATGDNEGRLALSSADGRQRWNVRVPVTGNGLIPEVAFPDVDGDSRLEVAAVGQRLGAEDRGAVVVVDGEGQTRWTQLVPGAVEDVAAVDLDGDGTDEVVVAEGRTAVSNDCAVSAFAGDGDLLWRTPMTSCIAPFIDAEEDDGTGRPAIAYGNLTLFEVPHIAMLNADGTIRWDHEISQSTAWLEIVAGGVVHGGFAGKPGHVTRRDADGDLVWQAFLEHQDKGGAVRYGTLLDTPEGFDVVVGSDAGVHRLDGADGAVKWVTHLEPTDTVATQAHQGGPVAVIERANAEPLIVAAEYAINRKRARTHVLDADGNPVWSAPMEGDAHGITVGAFRPDGRGVAVGAGLGLYSYELADAHLRPSDLGLALRRSGGTVVATASLTDGTGGALTGRRIDFTIDGAPAGFATSDAAGEANVSLRRADVPAGAIVRAVFAGDDIYDAAEDEVVVPKRW